MQRLAEHALTVCEAHTAAAPTERLCIATHEVRPVGELVRFVVGPDGSVVPDLKHRLPGRGVWITARRHLVEEAFVAGAVEPVTADPLATQEAEQA